VTGKRESQLETSFQLKNPRHEPRIETIAENNSTLSELVDELFATF
jgi:hypothetical protein